ncbi:hypothetical protein [Frigidibacter sp.]|uniref:hypothetical protein n=1 Tax=Frigidibacter sp. TaxID=2586418 RepID=UPI002733EA69|nr:hypothetical protein [Frigidibacter sp.]MDP3338735.1 hypothetical protein [Frigidibacter sp.]
MTERDDTKISAVVRRDSRYVAIHEVCQLPGGHRADGIALGFGKDGLRVLDGIVDQSCVAAVEAKDVQPWMSGIRWDLVQAAGGNWCLLNQGLRAAALTRMGDAVGLGHLGLGWPSPEQSWRMFRREDGSACMLRNQAGGWLSLAEDGPVMLVRRFDTPDDSLLWSVLDAAPMLHNSSTAGSEAL